MYLLASRSLEDEERPAEGELGHVRPEAILRLELRTISLQPPTVLSGYPKLQHPLTDPVDGNSCTEGYGR